MQFYYQYMHIHPDITVCPLNWRLLAQEVWYEPAEHAQLTSTLAAHAPPEHEAVVGQEASNRQKR